MEIKTAKKQATPIQTEALKSNSALETENWQQSPASARGEGGRTKWCFYSTVSGKNNPGTITVLEECSMGKGSYDCTKLCCGFWSLLFIKKFYCSGKREESSERNRVALQRACPLIAVRLCRSPALRIWPSNKKGFLLSISLSFFFNSWELQVDLE